MVSAILHVGREVGDGLRGVRCAVDAYYANIGNIVDN